MAGKVLITGIGGPAGRSAAVYFKAKGFSVIGTDIRPMDTGLDGFHILPMAVERGFQAALMDLIKSEAPDIFVPTVTEELLIVSGLKDRIRQTGCAVFISDPWAVEIANDKLKTVRFMEKNGVAVPRTFEGTAPKEEVIRELGLPLIAKPCFGRGGRGVTVYTTPEAVKKEDRQGIIFQEFIPGEEFDVNLFCGVNGETMAAVSLRKTVMKEGIVGNAVEVRRAARPDAVALAGKASRLLRLEGPLDFDIRLDPSGAPVLLEINARLGGNSLAASEVLDCFMDMDAFHSIQN